MIGEEEDKKHERIFLTNLRKGEMYLEVNWNKSAARDKVIKIVIGEAEAIVDSEELETVLLAFTQRPDKFVRAHNRKMGLKYVPVPIDQFKKYQKRQAHLKYKKKHG